VKPLCLVCAILAAAFSHQPPQTPAQTPAQPPVQAPVQPPATGRSQQPPRYQLTQEDRQRIQPRLDELESLVRRLKARHGEDDVMADVEIHAKAGRWLLEFPEDVAAEDDVANALAVLDGGLERARQLENGQSPWVTQTASRAQGFYSALDGSVQPYRLTVPESYDGTRSVPLYVWLHGRNARLTTANFIYAFSAGAPTQRAADLGQLQLDVLGRGNNANHWAGEIDVFEAIGAVRKRYKVDPARIVLRGFSLGGAASWHLALHYPDRWAAAEIGAGTWPRRYLMMDTFPPHQQPTLRIWENMTEWALNGFNLPIAAHDGDSDTQVASIPPPPPGSPTRGQLESSIRIREQLAREGYPSEGDPGSLAARGTPDIFLVSAGTGHGVSEPVRARLNAFLKEWTVRGQVSPDEIRFLTYTTRYNKSYWVSIEGLEKHYERAEVHARRTGSGTEYQITTKNVTRLALGETRNARDIRIDGRHLRVKSAADIVLERFSSPRAAGAVWRVAPSTRGRPGLHKTHALQGPIDDAFLDPFLLVRPTGTPWNDAVHQQALKTLERFDHSYARRYLAHPRVKDDSDVTEADFATYNVVLFGDPGSNRWIGRVNATGKLPVHWTRETVDVGGRSFPAAEHMPAFVYPCPLNPSRYVVLNSGLTFPDTQYNSDYSTPMLGDFAVLRVNQGTETPGIAYAGLFDESWGLPKN
jgi:hypothetical protein